MVLSERHVLLRTGSLLSLDPPLPLLPSEPARTFGPPSQLARRVRVRSGGPSTRRAGGGRLEWTPASVSDVLTMQLFYSL